MASTLRVTVVGAGRIGTLRAIIAAEGQTTELVNIVDVDQARSKALASALRCGHASDWARAVASPRTDVVVVSTTNDFLARVANAALSAGKHVLVEKPGATNSREMRALGKMAAKNHAVCKIGFNHRFHPAIARLRELYDKGELGSLSFVRVRHGHGGRLGYEHEWRADPRISGGGELIDQGVHGLDLIGWFMPRVSLVAAWANTCFWRMPVEDNALVMLKGVDDVGASLSVSWTQWKPVFSFEVYGSEGFAEVNGLGGAYGPETLIHGRKYDAVVDRTAFPHQDDSWRLEWSHFLGCVRNGTQPLSSAEESLRTLRIMEAAYLSARNSSSVLSIAGARGG